MTKFSASQQHQLAQIGAFLRENREKQSKSLEDIAIRTYIRPQLLNGIETGNPDILPEPIFVQGFIRRYAEALGLKGSELAQQFTVDSIPSTPRPAPKAPPTDTPTTRLTKNSANPAQSNAAPETPTFEPEPFVPPAAEVWSETFAQATAASNQSQPSDDPPKIPQNPWSAEEQSPLSQSPGVDLGLFQNAQTSVPQPSATEESIDVTSHNAAFFDPAFDPASNDDVESYTSQVNNGPDSGQLAEGSTSADLDKFSEASPSISSGGLASGNTRKTQSMDEAFASKMAAFDEASRTQPSLNRTNYDGAPGNSASFDDGLPAAFTTESPANNRPSLPLGVEYEEPATANLKPFIVGGILAAALTAGIVLLASLFGSGGRQPEMANTTQGSDTVAGQTSAASPEATETLPALPEQANAGTSSPAAAGNAQASNNKPPVSSAPVYLEASATGEAWVSIRADGNPTPIFEGTLQPGETKVWEAQKELDVYSGDSGALKLAPNGNEAKVLGERGQPGGKIFTPQNLNGTPYN